MAIYAVETAEGCTHYATKAAALTAVKTAVAGGKKVWVQWVVADKAAGLPPEIVTACRVCGEAPTTKPSELSTKEAADLETRLVAKVATRAAARKVAK